MALSSGLYDVGSDLTSSNVLDDTWQLYEADLPEALDGLTRSDLDEIPIDYLTRVLVPLVAGLLVRGPEFGPHHDARIPGVRLVGNRSNQHWARWTEMTRLTSALLAAEWGVVTFDGPTKLITSDRGYAWSLLTAPDGSQWEDIVVPVSREHVLIVSAQQTGLVARRNGGGEWRAPLARLRQSATDADALNHAMAGAAFEMIVGGDRADVERYSLRPEGPVLREPLDASWPPSRVLRYQEFDWFRLTQLTGQTRAGCWTPMPLRSEDPGGISATADEIRISLIGTSELDAIIAERLKASPPQALS